MQWLKKGSSICHVLYGQIRLLICDVEYLVVPEKTLRQPNLLSTSLWWLTWCWTYVEGSDDEASFDNAFIFLSYCSLRWLCAVAVIILLKKLKSMSHTTVFQIEEIICPTSSSMGKSKGRRSIFSKTLACKHSSMNFEIIAYTYMYYLRIWGDWQRRRYYCPCNWEVYR